MENQQFNPLASMPCMNCKTPVKQDDVRLFQGVFCCSKCHELATRAFQRLERELKYMLTLAGETIRLALVKGEFQLGPADQPHEIPKSELMRKLIAHVEDREKKAEGQP